jgi:dGTPase
VEDGLRAGMFSLEDLQKVELLKNVSADIRRRYPDIAEHYLVQETIREMIGAMVQDVLAESRRRLQSIKAGSPDDIRMAKTAVVGFSPHMNEQVEELRSFLFDRMYHHYTVMRMRSKAERVINDLFYAFLDRYNLLPDHWQRRVEEAGGTLEDIQRARIVCDYIAGMTDRYAIREHERLFDIYWDKR